MKLKNVFNFVTLFVCMMIFTVVMMVHAQNPNIVVGMAQAVEIESTAIPSFEEELATPFPYQDIDDTYKKPTGHALHGKKLVMGRAEAGQQVVVSYKNQKVIGQVDSDGNYSVTLNKKIAKKETLKVQLLKNGKLSKAKTIKTVKKNAPVMYCKAYTLIDLSSGEVIASSKKRKKIYPASTTKMMTGILALEHFDNTSTMLTASKKAIYGIGAGGSNAGSRIGEKMSVQNWLNALMISSANEAANVLAEGISGSKKEFAKLMNLKATEIGAYNTNFVNPSGLPNKKHYTTVEDLAIIGRYAMQVSNKHKAFRKIVSKSKYVLPATNKHNYKRKYRSTNKLHGVPSNVYSKIIGVKTGYTSISSHNFVGCAEDKTGRKMLCVVAGVYPTYGEHGIFTQCKRMLEYGFNISQGNFE